jgi:hypothetical protein
MAGIKELCIVAEARGEANIKARRTSSSKQLPLLIESRRCRKRRKRSPACLTASIESSHLTWLTSTPEKPP